MSGGCQCRGNGHTVVEWISGRRVFSLPCMVGGLESLDLFGSLVLLEG